MIPTWKPPIFIVLGLFAVAFGVSVLPEPFRSMGLPLFNGFLILIILHREGAIEERLIENRNEIVLAIKRHMAESYAAIEAQANDIADKLRQETDRSQAQNRQEQDQRHGKLSEQLGVIADAATKAYDEANHANQKIAALAAQRQGDKLDAIAATIDEAKTTAAAEHQTLGTIEIATTETNAIVKQKLGANPPSTSDRLDGQR